MPDNEYKDFNNYEQPEQETAEQPELQSEVSFPVQQQTPQQTAKGLGSLSIMLGLFGCCAFPATAVGLTLGILGVIRDKNSIESIVGIVLNAAVLFMWVYSFIVLAANPETMQAYMDTFAQFYSQQ